MGSVVAAEAKIGAKNSMAFADGHEPHSIPRMLEDVLGCKWTVQILMRVRGGVCRPGALERSLDGLTTKVLNERLAKLTRFHILERQAYPEIPPRVEYVLSPFGERFVALLDEVEQLSREFPGAGVK